jgi:hypothetical protein
MAATTQGTPAFEKLTSYKSDAKLSHLTSQVCFLRFKAAAVTLNCEMAFTRFGASASIERQAYWLLSSNLPDSYAFLLATHTTAKGLYDALQADFQGKSLIRKADLYQELSQLRPTHEGLDEFLNRALELRTAFKSADIDDDVLLSAFFLISLRDTEQFRDLGMQKMQIETPDDIPKLFKSLRTTFRDRLTDHVTSTPVANQARAQDRVKCTSCGKGMHTILDCFQLQRDLKSREDSRSASVVARGTQSIRGRGGSFGRGGRGGRGGRDGADRACT